MTTKPSSITPTVILVDHGSPLPEVTEARRWLATWLSNEGSDTYEVIEAAMERRPGIEFEFNGPLLAESLQRLGASGHRGQIIVAMQFVGPGRHAGPRGDIESICSRIRQRFPRLRIAVSPLVGEDDGLIEILADRAHTALVRARF